MNEIQTVSELTFAIKKQLETGFSQVSVRGEISNFKSQASGHLYFTLKDANAQVSAVLFRGNAAGLSRLPKDGDQVVVKGELSVYAPRGNYQIIVRQLSYAGVGELLLKLHELKSKLEAKGWFDKGRKKPLPKFPRIIGVVTSPTGSVIQDILQILTRRFSGFHLILNPVKVQGDGAAGEIASAIQQFNEHHLADLLIVGRGGGSLEDLWAFNEEIVAEAIYNSKIPIISAVGHETDVCIADFVADVRAPTPSAAAEIATTDKAHHLQFLESASLRIEQYLRGQIRSQALQLKGITRHPLFQSAQGILGRPQQLMDEMIERLDDKIAQSLREKQLSFGMLTKAIQAREPTLQIATHRQKLEQLISHLRTLDPKNLLSKGYCILYDEKKNSVILSSKTITPQETLRIQLADGSVRATVMDVT